MPTIYPEIPNLYGIWLGEGWMLLGAEDMAGSLDMPHCFFSIADAETWIDMNPDFRNGVIIPMN